MVKRTRFSMLPILVALLAVLAACGGTPAAAPTAAPAPTTAPAPAAMPTDMAATAAPTTAPNASGYPVTVQSCGRTLTFTKAPEHVFVDYQTQLELMLRLGLGDHIAAYTGFGEVPLAPDVVDAYAKIKDRAVKLDAFPNKEQAVTAGYDLATLAFPAYMYDVSKGQASRDEWEKAGTQMYESNADCAGVEINRTIEASFQQVRDIGRIFNVLDQAEALVGQMQQTLDMVHSKVNGLPKLKAAILDDINDKSVPYFYAAGIYANMIERAGGENVFADQAKQYTEISAEVVAERPVDVLFVMQWEGGMSPEKKAEYYFKTFPNAPVSKSRRFAVLTNMELNAGSGNAIAVEKMARALHPEAFADASTASYPVTIQNCGKTLTFDKAPTRVLVTYQSVAETMVALGLTDKIVAVNFGKSAEPPTDLATAVNGLNYLSPPGKGAATREVALSTHPDLIISAYPTYDFDASQGLATRDDFTSAGAKIYDIIAGCEGNDTKATLEDTYQDILNIGKIFGVSAKAEALVQQFRAQVADVQQRVAGLPPMRAAIYDGGEGPLGFYAAGLYADMVARAGGVNVFADQGKSYAEVNAEAVATSNPDIFVIDDYIHASLPADKRANYLFKTFPNTPASKQKRWVAVLDAQFAPGIRNVAGIVEMAKAFHPEAFK